MRVTDPQELTLLTEKAHCYAKMVSGVKELAYLRNLDTGEKLTPREIVRATAAKVGLAVPSVSTFDNIWTPINVALSSFLMNTSLTSLRM
jgi:hypothetical protein